MCGTIVKLIALIKSPVFKTMKNDILEVLGFEKLTIKACNAL